MCCLCCGPIELQHRLGPKNKAIIHFLETAHGVLLTLVRAGIHNHGTKDYVNRTHHKVGTVRLTKK